MLLKLNVEGIVDILKMSADHPGRQFSGTLRIYLQVDQVKLNSY